MEDILHQLIWRICQYLRGFIHPRWLAGFPPSTVSCYSILGLGPHSYRPGHPQRPSNHLASHPKNIVENRHPCGGKSRKYHKKKHLNLKPISITKFQNKYPSWWFQPSWKYESNYSNWRYFKPPPSIPQLDLKSQITPQSLAWNLKIMISKFGISFSNGWFSGEPC